jgi:predicted ATPase
MYIKSFTIENIRSIKKLEWEVTLERCPGWHVIIGDNGSGKSSVLRSIALALVGPREAMALRQDWNDWLRSGEAWGHIGLHIDFHKGLDKFSGRGRRVENFFLWAGLYFDRSNGSVKLSGDRSERPLGDRSKMPAERHVWGGKAGWFSASYGPFRRFSGGDPDVKKIFYSNPKLARHLSIFGENVALTESLEWLQSLQFKKLEKDPEGDLVDHVERFVNQPDFLPLNTRLSEISSRGVFFIDGNGCTVPVENLSDGFRSILSLTFELIRQLAGTFRPNVIFDKKDPTKVNAPGVVLIDEVDAHLHPSWQRRIGLWFRTYFPKLQFLVTTHSPLVCQAAEVGTVYRLSKPGSDEKSRMIEGEELQRLVYGNVLDAYSTDAFGQDVSRSDESKRRLKRLAELNLKELSKPLSAKEGRERDSLRAALPTAAHTVNTQGTGE